MILVVCSGVRFSAFGKQHISRRGPFVSSTYAPVWDSTPNSGSAVLANTDRPGERAYRFPAAAAI